MKQRYYSLDVFRGATVAFMILVNNPGSWAHIFSPLDHAPWHGCTPTDLVFPFFLFAVGNALAFVMPKWEQAGTAAFLKKVFRRSLLIFAIGLFLNWSPFVQWSGDQLLLKHWVNPDNPDSGIRILGVLQRIAISYFFASLIIYFAREKKAFVIGAILLLLYWWLCLALGTAGDPYSIDGWFGTAFDRAVLHVPHMYKGEGRPFDPEGLASTLPAIVQVILGYLVGLFIREQGKRAATTADVKWEMLARLLIVAILLVFVGFCWDMVFPINKKIWTSSYVLYTTGLAIMVLGVIIYLTDIKEQKPAWSRFFVVFGKNPLFIFFLSGFLPRTLGLIRWTDHVGPDGKNIYTSPLPWFYTHVCKPLSDNLKLGSLIYALCIIVFMWLIVYWLDKRKIYIKV